MTETKRDRYIRLLSKLTNTEVTLTANATREILALLKESPVVRCKHCKNYDKHIYYCEKLGINIDDNDFCSFSERKDGDNG